MHVTLAETGAAGLDIALRKTFDLIVIDQKAPGLDSLTLVKILRGDPRTEKATIFVVSARDSESDIIVGLELGADEYICKPIKPNEFIARVRAVLRRVRRELTLSAKSGRMLLGSLALDIERFEVFSQNRPIDLTLAEFRVLQAMVSRPGRIFTRQELLEKINDSSAELSGRNVDVHIRNIRQKLALPVDMIMTARGIGYGVRKV